MEDEPWRIWWKYGTYCSCPAPQGIFSSCWPSLGFYQQGSGRWPSIQELVSCGSVFGACEEIMFCFVNQKKYATSKLIIMFYWVSLLRTIAGEGSFSDSSEGLIQRGKGGTSIYRSFCLKKKKHGVKHQKITLVTNTRHLKLMLLVLFCVWQESRVSISEFPSWLSG